MNPAVDPKNADAWARQVQALDDDAEYARLLGVLAAAPSSALALLDALARSTDPVVRAWAGNTASKLFQRAAIPILSRLSKDRDPDVRDASREDWIAVDPGAETSMLPAARRTLRRGKHKWGEDQAAMYRVARLRDHESIPILREYASRYGPGEWHNRMPLVLADYIEDPDSIGRRIRAHDHDFMFWLADAAVVLGLKDGFDALHELLAKDVDDACAKVARQRIERIG